MDGVPIISSSHFNWIGFTGFGNTETVGGPLGMLHLHNRLPFALRSTKTQEVVRFEHRVSNRNTLTSEIESFVYDGHTPDGNLMTLLIYND